MDVQTRHYISRTVEGKGKSYMSRRLAQPQMTLSDLERPFYPHHPLSLR